MELCSELRPTRVLQKTAIFMCSRQVQTSVYKSSRLMVVIPFGCLSIANLTRVFSSDSDHDLRLVWCCIFIFRVGGKILSYIICGVPRSVRCEEAYRIGKPQCGRTN